MEARGFLACILDGGLQPWPGPSAGRRCISFMRAGAALCPVTLLLCSVPLGPVDWPAAALRPGQELAAV